jgi:hypothetical protein
MITELSTTSPKSIAPRLIRLPATPASASGRRRRASTAGSPSATISPARRLPRKRRAPRPPAARPRAGWCARSRAPRRRACAGVDRLDVDAGRQRPRAPRQPRAQGGVTSRLFSPMQHEPEAEHASPRPVGGDRAAAQLGALRPRGDVAHPDGHARRARRPPSLEVARGRSAARRPAPASLAAAVERPHRRRCRLLRSSASPASASPSAGAAAPAGSTTHLDLPLRRRPRR